MRLRPVMAVSIGLAIVASAAPAGASYQPAKACPAGFNQGHSGPRRSTRSEH